MAASIRFVITAMMLGFFMLLTLVQDCPNPFIVPRMNGIWIYNGPFGREDKMKIVMPFKLCYNCWEMDGR
jgi:hypothetical protein